MTQSIVLLSIQVNLNRICDFFKEFSSNLWDILCMNIEKFKKCKFVLLPDKKLFWFSYESQIVALTTLCFKKRRNVTNRHQRSVWYNYFKTFKYWAIVLVFIYLFLIKKRNFMLSLNVLCCMYGRQKYSWSPSLHSIYLQKEIRKEQKKI